MTPKVQQGDGADPPGHPFLGGICLWQKSLSSGGLTRQFWNARDADPAKRPEGQPVFQLEIPKAGLPPDQQRPRPLRVFAPCRDQGLDSLGVVRPDKLGDPAACAFQNMGFRAQWNVKHG